MSGRSALLLVLFGVSKSLGIGALAWLQLDTTIAYHHVPLWIAVGIPAELILWTACLITYHRIRSRVRCATRDQVYDEVYEIAATCQH